MAAASKAGLQSYSPFKRHEGRRHLLEEGVRLDGRLPGESRSPYMRAGTVSQAAGSAYAEFGDTKVLVAVYGPREGRGAQSFSSHGRLACDVKVASFATPVRGRYSGMDEKEMASLMQRALEGAVVLASFPKATVDIFAIVLASGGADMAALITCASMALADAGVEMYDLVACVSASRCGEELLMDPILGEERSEDGSALVAAMVTRHEITHLSLSGEWSQTSSTDAVEQCMESCAALDQYVRSSLREAAAGAADA